MRETVGVVKRYKQHFEEHNPGASFNPYTVIRHCLYLSSRSVFRPALRKSARESFEVWLQEHGEPRGVELLEQRQQPAHEACFSLQVMHTRVQGMAFSRAWAISSRVGKVQRRSP